MVRLGRTMCTLGTYIHTKKTCAEGGRKREKIEERTERERGRKGRREGGREGGRVDEWKREQKKD